MADVPISEDYPTRRASFIFARNVSFAWTAIGMVIGAFIMPIVIAATSPKTTEPSSGLSLFYTILAFPIVCILSIAAVWGAHRLLIVWGPDAAQSAKWLQWIAAALPAAYLLWRVLTA